MLARAAFRTLSRTAGLARPSAVNMARPAVANFATTGEYKTLTEYEVSCEAGASLAKHPTSSNCKPIDSARCQRCPTPRPGTARASAGR